MRNQFIAKTKRFACLAAAAFMCVFMSPASVLADGGAYDFQIPIRAVGQAGAGNAEPESFLYDSDGNLIPEVPASQVSSVPGDGLHIGIRQSMLSFADFAAPSTAVYRIDAVLDGDTVYSDVFGITAEDCQEKLVTVGGKGEIPVGADVTVSLLYGGPSYSLYSGQDAAVDLGKVAGDTAYTVDFGLVYDFSYKFGYGIVNPFHADPPPVADDGDYRLPDTGSVGTDGIARAGLALACAGLAGACLGICGKGGRRHA